MNGSAFIINSSGVICSNDAQMMTDREISRNDEGKIISSRHTEIIRVTNFMKVTGLVEKHQDAYCQFMFDETNKVQTFSVVVSTITDGMIILNLKALNLHNKEVTETIKKKIKEEIKNGRS
jgi:hypothetical protein